MSAALAAGPPYRKDTAIGYFKNLAVEAMQPCGHDREHLVNWHRWIGPGQMYEDSTYCRECFRTDADGSRAADRVRRGGRP